MELCGNARGHEQHATHGHIDGAGLGLLFEGQMPARGGAAGPLEGAERAFQERADLAEAAQGGLAAGGVPIGGQ